MSDKFNGQSPALGSAVLGVGEVARACRVAARTVGVWIDRGRLPGYRLPGSRARRVTRADLARFMREYGLPGADEVEGAACAPVLLVGLGPRLASRVALALGGGFAVETAADGFEAGLAVAKRLPAVVVIDTALGRGEARAIAVRLLRLPDWRGVLVGLACEDAAADDLAGVGFNCVLGKPCDPERVAACVRKGVGA